MRCGARCFIVKMEHNNEIEYSEINARSPAEARKFIRRKFGKEIKVISVKQK